MTTYDEEILAHHQRRVDRLRSGTGWLSLVDKVFLSPGSGFSVTSLAALRPLQPTS